MPAALDGLLVLEKTRVLIDAIAAAEELWADAAAGGKRAAVQRATLGAILARGEDMFEEGFGVLDSMGDRAIDFVVGRDDDLFVTC